MGLVRVRQLRFFLLGLVAPAAWSATGGLPPPPLDAGTEEDEAGGRPPRSASSLSLRRSLREKFLKRDGRVGRPPDDEERERDDDEGSSSGAAAAVAVAAATAANSDEEVGERGELSLPHGE